MTQLTAKVDRETVAPGGSSVRVSLQIQPGMQETPVQRQIALCVDTSGSMSGSKIEQLREGILWVFGYLEDEDYVSIVTFDDEVEVVLPATRWGDMTLDEAEAVVDDITPGGGTDILAGLEAAVETLADLPEGEDIGRRILLLSDGRDDNPTEAFANLARRVRREQGIAIPAAGIGEFYDKDTIHAIGTASEGEWVHLSQAGDIENFFGRKVETLRTVVAPSPNLQLDLAEGASVGDVFLRRPQVRDASHEWAGDSFRVYLPDLVEFETQEVVLTIQSPPCTAGQPFTLADVTLSTSSERSSTRIEVGCAADSGTAQPPIEDESVTVKHVETVVRKAVGDGDIARAETIVQQIREGGDPAAVAQEETVVEGQSVTQEETVIEPDAGQSAADAEQSAADEGVSEEETVIERDAEDGTSDVGGEETVIERESDDGTADLSEEETVIERDAEDGTSDLAGEETVIERDTGADESAVSDLETVIDRQTLSDLETVIDDDAVSDLETVIESADEDDLEAQYETTVIRDEDAR